MDLEAASEGRSTRAEASYKYGRTIIARLVRLFNRTLYKRALNRPVDPKLAVFSAYFGRGYMCNPRAVYEAAISIVPGLKGVWVVQDEETKAKFPADVSTVILGSRAYYATLARAGVLVNNVQFPDDIVKRKGVKFVQTQHGTPLKLMGQDRKGTPSANNMRFETSARRAGRWDFNISSNAHSSKVWKSAYPGEYVSLDVGYPRNDILVTASPDDRNKWRSELGIEPAQKVILYAPTIRDYTDTYMLFLDIPELANRLGESWTILNRKHHSYNAGDEASASSGAQVIDVSFHPCVEGLCIASDLLVTDYSSLMFDYAVQSKPIVIYAPDWERYKASRGVYFDLLTEAPGPIARTEDELFEALDLGQPWEQPAKSQLARFQENFCVWDRGDAAARVVDAIWGSGRQPRLERS